MQPDHQSQQEVRDMQERVVVPGMLNISTLEEHSISEIENDGIKDSVNALFSVELLHRAVWQGNQEAREMWQRCFSGILRDWLNRHPQKEEACNFGSEEHYLTQAFERFWQAIAERSQLEFTLLSTALHYLQASLNSVLLDTLRAHPQPRWIPPELGNVGSLHLEDDMDGQQLWERIQVLFPNAREQRAVYLLFHCNLSPSEILRCAPQEFRDVQEICQLRREILQRILLNSDIMSIRTLNGTTEMRAVGLKNRVTTYHQQNL